ncbi:protein-serine/threonine phosphatase [Malassezia vespertilionis]|uniref:Nem1p n=1 Tax=Malassezia vespertilionis TaxID=2020962 RepID=A0A2N1J8D1_9BASI|nr:protein-serine/threonine phosphatase [Malassezia vespertilionis]PKI82815.1 Nem1p [Malassezia vespertilionis]WFD08353.1 protein-serine/threonine phosphatase [Malassezia vespertilionis]
MREADEAGSDASALDSECKSVRTESLYSNTSAASSAASLPSVETLVRQRTAANERVQPSHDAPPKTQEPRARIARGPSSLIQQTPKVLVLDLDETLIHSTLRTQPVWGILGAPYTPNNAEKKGANRSNGIFSFLGLGARTLTAQAPPSSRLQPAMIEVTIDGHRIFYQVYKRPWVDYFLRKVASWYHVVIFTASMKEYADPVIDWLDDGQGLISGRLFRDSCTLRNGTYLKDLVVVEPDLRRVCLVDNSPVSYVLQEANGIPVEGWTHDPTDEALLDLLPILDGLRYATDVRHILGVRGF